MAPAVELTEAIERLRLHGHGQQANALADKLAELTDVCRFVRYQLWYPDRLPQEARLP